MEDKKSQVKLNKFGMLKSQYEHYSSWYILIVGLIALFEVALIIYNIFRGFTDNWKGITYFVCYVFLFAVSFFVLCVMIYNRTTKKGIKLLVNLLSLYGILLLLWATVISAVDVYRGNSIIVYLTIIAIIAAILPIHPVKYLFTIIPTTLILIGTIMVHGYSTYKSYGYIFNVSIFILFSLILSIISYRTNYNQYLAKIKLQKLTEIDQLTGVYNRYALKNDIDLMINSSVYSFGIVDIDDFKKLNDEFGHEVGDECLVDVANRLRKKFGDNIYRFGGDEFCMLLQLPEIEIRAMFNEINDELSLKYLDKSLNISGGFYTPSSCDESYQEIFKKADKALYNAKREGKNRAVFYRNE